jgi:nucleoside-diphosphate-sugar epimerase
MALMKKILITGVNGFVGKHLVREISTRGHTAYGAGREETAHPEISSILSAYFIADLTNPDEVAKIPLEDIDVVISLAGLARAGDSFKDPEKYLKINVDVATVLAEEILNRGLNAQPRPRLHFGTAIQPYWSGAGTGLFSPGPLPKNPCSYEEFRSYQGRGFKHEARLYRCTRRS